MQQKSLHLAVKKKFFFCKMLNSIWPASRKASPMQHVGHHDHVFLSKVLHH